MERDLKMIYLIGGSPRVGKSTLAGLLSKENSVPYISADDIGAVILPYIPVSEHPTKLPLHIIRKETQYSNDIFYSKYSADETIAFYIQNAETQWLGFESFIKYVVSDEHNYIVEGWQLLPRLVSSVITSENKEKIVPCYLYKNNVDEIVSGLKSSTAKNDWVINNTKKEATFTAIAKMISSFGNYIKTEAEKYDLRAVNVDFDFYQKIKELCKIL